MAKRTSGPRKALGSGKRGALGSGKAKAFGSGKAKALGSGKAAAIGSSRKARVTSSRRAAIHAAGKPTGGVHLICRECLEEWSVDPDQAQKEETISCPLCEHRCQPPSDDILHQINLYKGIEQKNLTLALGSLGVGLFAMFIWTLLTGNPERADHPVVFYVPIALAVIAFVATLAFGARYESSRWETYF